MPAHDSTPRSLVCNILQIERNQPMVSSLTIAKEFERPHKNVLQSIRKELAEEIDRLEVKPIEYTDDSGRIQPAFLLTERQALFVMPFIGGRKSREGQRKLVDAYLYYRDHFKEPPRKAILKEKRAAHHPMMDALIEHRRDEEGKDTKFFHHVNENKICNNAVIGECKPIDEKTLSNADAELLALVRKRNEAYILAGLEYKTRKAKLVAYAMKQRTKLLN